MCLMATDLPLPENPMIDHRLPLHHVEGETIEDVLGSEGLVDVFERDHPTAPAMRGERRRLQKAESRRPPL